MEGPRFGFPFDLAAYLAHAWTSVRRRGSTFATDPLLLYVVYSLFSLSFNNPRLYPVELEGFCKLVCGGAFRGASPAGLGGDIFG